MHDFIRPRSCGRYNRDLGRVLHALYLQRPNLAPWAHWPVPGTGYSDNDFRTAIFCLSALDWLWEEEGQEWIGDCVECGGLVLYHRAHTWRWIPWNATGVCTHCHLVHNRNIKTLPVTGMRCPDWQTRLWPRGAEFEGFIAVEGTSTYGAISGVALVSQATTAYSGARPSWGPWLVVLRGLGCENLSDPDALVPEPV